MSCSRRRKSREIESDIRIIRKCVTDDRERLRSELNFRLACDAEIKDSVRGSVYWLDGLEVTDVSYKNKIKKERR